MNVEENSDIARVLKTAAIAENTEVFNLTQILPRIQSCQANVKGILSVSPTKLLIVFDNENDVMNAVDMESPLWNVFDDVRLWSEGELFDDRLVWIECVGLHPLCWSKDNLKLIGEKWRQVMHIENKVQGVDSITSARILLRTKAQNRIENRIKLFSEHSSCDVWVKELYGNCGLNGVYDNKNVVIPLPAHIDDKMEERLIKKHYSSNPITFPDPLVQEMGDNMNLRDKQEWVDPMVWNENIHWENAGIRSSCPNLCTPVSTPLSNSRPSRPRGRPRRSSQQQIPPETPSHGSIETRKTWEVAQLLGISSHEEEAVLSGLRKSKRILLLEGKGA